MKTNVQFLKDHVRLQADLLRSFPNGESTAAMLEAETAAVARLIAEDLPAIAASRDLAPEGVARQVRARTVSELARLAKVINTKLDGLAEAIGQARGELAAADGAVDAGRLEDLRRATAGFTPEQIAALHAQARPHDQRVLEHLYSDPLPTVGKHGVSWSEVIPQATIEEARIARVKAARPDLMEKLESLGTIREVVERVGASLERSLVAATPAEPPAEAPRTPVKLWNNAADAE
jgi:hypothetical protein